VGCTTPPTPDPDPDPTPTPVVVVSATPVLTAVETSAAVSIFDVTSTSTLYMNKAEAGSSILVKGTAPVESLVKVYLGGVAISTVAETSVTGLWTIAIAASALGVDGVKVLTAKVTEVGLAESAASNSVTFTLDTVLPSATTLAATAGTTVNAGTCTSTITAGLAMVDSFVTTGALGTLAAGTWTIKTVAASGTTGNVVISDGTTSTSYSVKTAAWFNGIIPGVKFEFEATALVAAGNTTTLVITKAAAIADRARVLFSEEITAASAILLANYVFSTAAVVNVPTAVSYADKYMYFSPMVTAALISGNTLACTVNGVIDLAGNIQTTASSLTCTVGAASATTLAP